MKTEKCFVIEWFGPFKFDDLKTRMSPSELKGYNFYAISGLCKRERGTPIWQYIGITERLVSERLKDRDHKNSIITRNKEIWLGRFSNHLNSRKRENIELVEHLIVCSFDIALNEKKTKSFPHEPVGIINTWFTKDGKRRIKKLHVVQKDLADVIFYDGENIWTSDKMKYWM